MWTSSAWSLPIGIQGGILSSFGLAQAEDRCSGSGGRPPRNGSALHRSHFAIALLLPELLVAGERLNRLGVPTRNFTGEKTTEPSVIGWMPSAQLYFPDPDDHSLEFITVLDDPPDPAFIAVRFRRGESQFDQSARSEWGTACGLETRDTADWKSAVHVPQVSNLLYRRLPVGNVAEQWRLVTAPTRIITSELVGCQMW